MKRNLLIALSFFCCFALQAQSLQGKVIAVLDGDTFELLLEGNKKERIRLAEIDAPEKAQDYGQKSKETLSGFIFGKQVEVKAESKDRYGRTIGTVYLNGENINYRMVALGMAWQYEQYSRSQSLKELQNKAKEQRLGLWAGKDPIAPWIWRRTKK